MKEAYLLANKTSGLDLGEFLGTTPLEAYQAMMADAGYTRESAIGAGFAWDEIPADVLVTKAAGQDYRIGGSLTVRMTAAQADTYNAGDMSEAEIKALECSIPTSGADRSYVRDGEVVINPGLPGSWDGTIGEAIAAGILSWDDIDGEEAVIA